MVGVGRGGMDASFKLTRQEIAAAYDAGRDAVIALVEGLIERQEQRLAALEQELQELKQDSHDSGKPPSRDSIARKQLKRRSSRRQRTEQRRPGGQPEHPGTTLRQAEQPDRVTIHAVERCGCGRSLVDEPVAEWERRQVFDVPPMQVEVEVSEHRAERKRCPCCGTLNRAEFPEAVAQPVQYGPRLQGIAAYLKNYGLLPYQRTAELFEDLFSIPISVGTLVSINELCGQQLEAVNDTIRSALRDESVIGVDETGMSVEGKLWWLHVASTELLTCYTPHRKRGREAMAEIGILPDFGGVAVHDHWQSYFGYDCHHGLCNAHHLRELTFIEEQYGQAWASDLQDLLLRVKEAVASAVLAGRSRLYGPVRDRFAAEYRRIIKAGMRANPPPPATQTRKRGRRKQSKPRNLLLRLASRWREVLAFMYDFRVPFTNNQAERDLRMMKVQQKISGTFRSEDGAVAFCQTRSYISTIRKNGGNVIEALTSVFAGNPIVPPCLTSAIPAE